MPLLLLAAALRIPLLTDYRLHADEALFATLGRLIAQGIDPLLAHTPLLVDKPPLFYYSVAAGVSMGWADELAARMPGTFAGVVSVALTARLAYRLWGSQRAAQAAALIAACSPFAVLFSPTVFADPLMVMWWLAALCAAASGRSGWAGLWSAAALATKQNALFLLPLVGLVWFTAAEDPRLADGLRFAAGMVPVLALMLLWEAARPGVSFWEAGVAANNPGRLIRRGEVLPRLQGWWAYLRVIGGGALPTAAIGAAALAAPFVGRPRTRAGTVTLILIAYLLGYVAFLWLVAFPLLDRYLLPVVPLLALLIGRVAEHVSPVALTGLILLPFVLAGGYPVGGDRGATDGIEQVAAFFDEQAEGTVLYYQGMGWPLAYYLFDGYTYLAPVGSPAGLTTDVRTFGAEGSYLLLAAWESHSEPLHAIEAAGYSTEAVLITENRHGQPTLTLYRITSRGQP